MRSERGTSRPAAATNLVKRIERSNLAFAFAPAAGRDVPRSGVAAAVLCRFSRVSCFLFLLTFGFFVANGADTQNPASAPQPFIVGLSPFLDNANKDDVYRSLVRLLAQDLPLNSSFTVYDAFQLKTITHVDLPQSPAFHSPKTRANQFAGAIREIKQFLAQNHFPPTNSHLKFEEAIRLPQFLDFLADNLRATNATVLLIGSPLYQDAREPGFSMVDGYFPSDGHLHASREQSVFGFTADGSATSLTIDWLYFKDPWLNDLHKGKVTRFWTLYLERRGAQLAAFTSDLPSALHSLQQNAPGSIAASRNWSADSTQRKIEMLRVSRNVEVADWLTGNAAAAQTPPTILVGPMKIGIRWKHNIDLDLYATPRRGAETLFFEHVRSPEGYYYKDHRSSPGREYEFIEFESPVDAREVEAFVNFYKGNCPGGPHGEVRIEFDGRIYAAPFAISGEEGNLGRSGESQQEFWSRIPVQEILKLSQRAASRGDSQN
jgi:hypothetical protein